MRSPSSFLVRLSPLCLALVAACSSPRSSGNDPGPADAAADAAADLGADVGSPADAPADVGLPDVPVVVDAPVGDAVDATPDDVATTVDASGDVGFDVTADLVTADLVTADVAPDAPADVAADAPPLPCRSDRDCGARSQLCERTRGVCVDCLTTVDCLGTDVCSGNRCVPPPPPCRSDRDCSARMQVCSTTRMVCTDCNADRDCPAGNYCDPEGSCAALACTPNSATCADDSTRRVCSADGRTLTTTPCPTVVNGASRCADGACTSSCNAGFADCDGSAANGCEVDLRASVASCGRCGNACPAQGGVPGCAGGACTLACLTGRGDCDANAANGCETNLASSNAHCGRCGAPCSAGQTCADGVCVISGCPSGQTLCAGGCVDLNTSVAQCGACGRACSLPNATPACTAGTCVVAGCAAGLGDCDRLAGNGCEDDTSRDVLNCGACGVVCPTPPGSVAACIGGSCGINCQPGFASCDGANINGCEVSLNTSAANCGACGRACAAGQTCQAGTCVTTTTCGAGLTACPGGVCRDLTVDPANCGACGRACGAAQVCNASTCAAATMRFSLTWNVTADLDIAVATPSGVVINYAHRTEGSGSLIDDSMTTGPEVIFWSAAPPPGTYYVCAIPYRVSAATTYTLQAFIGATLNTNRMGTYTVSAAAGATCSATSPYKILDFVVP